MTIEESRRKMVEGTETDESRQVLAVAASQAAFSPYRNLAHWLSFRRSTKTQYANDEPANLEGVGTKWR